MIPSQAVQFAVTFVLSASVGTVIGNVIKATTPVVVSKLDKVLIGIGYVVISSAVADASIKSLYKSMGWPVYD